jgi:hypothetical protein
VSAVPLADGMQVVTHVTRCDRGANPYCAVQMVVVGRHFPSSTALLTSEKRHLKALGWTTAGADNGDERGADSPGHKFRITYATASLDLKGIDLGWIQRSPVIIRSLSRTMFGRDSALSIMLETGSS